MSDDDGWVDVAQPKPAADDGWVNVNTAPPTQPEGPQGGLMQTIPQGVEMISSAEGRAKLWEGVKKLPGDLAQGMIDFVKTPGKALNEGVTPEEEVEFGLNAALGTIGTASKFRIPRAAIESITPHVQEFNDGVMQPAAQQLAHDAVASPPAMLNEIKARSGQPENAPTGITAYHGSPHSFDAFSTEKIGTGEGAQSYGHGLYFAQSEGVARSYRDALGGDSATVEGKKYNPYNPLHAASAQIEESGSRVAAIKDMAATAKADTDPEAFTTRVLSILQSNREIPKIDNPTGTLYQVRINADPEAMLDWDKKLNEQSPQVQNAVKQAMGVDYHGNFDPVKSERLWNEFQHADAGVAVRQGFIASDDELVTQRLNAAGVPGIKYFDRGSRDTGDGTRNFVVFNEGDVQITHKNGEPIPTPMLDNIIQAKQAGLIGPDIPPPSNETPAKSAQRAMPAASQQGDKITMTPAGEPIDAWEQRFNRYVDKTTTPDDFKTLVKDMASQSNNFPEARAGTVAPEMVARVAEAAGLDSSAIDSGKLRTTFRTDDEIRTVTTLLKKLGDDVQAAAEAVRTDDSPESLAAFQAAIIKRDYALEATLSHTAALRAEWGRSGNALQEILKAQKGEDALTGLLKDKGRSIDDLRDIARGLNGLDREQAAKVLTGMRGQAPHWFYWLWSQGLISGPFTHAKYVLANATYAGMERGIVTPLASIIGKAKELARTPFEAERVIDAAVKFNGKIYTGANHLEAMEKAAAEHGTDVENLHTKADDNKQSQLDSWVTSSGRFVDSKEAARIANSPHAKLDSSDKEFAQQRAAAVDRVFFGEAAAGHWGTIAAVPDAIKASWQTIKTGMKVPLESEKTLHQMAIAAGEKPSTALSRAIEPNLQPPRPIPGIWGRILGSPGDVASSIHVAFKVMGERANLQTWAYNKTAAEGLSPTSPQFWQRRAYHATNPSEQVLKDTVYQAYKDTFMQELGDHAKAFQKFTKDVPGLKWVFPFTHIPINLMKATYEYTPFAALDKDMRANIKGENGGRQQDLAIARMTVGSSVMAYFTNAYMQGKVTSNYPTDPNERKDWALQGKPANSIQIGERWVSFERFGPAGDLAQIGAAIGSIVHRFAMDNADPAKGTDEAISHAVWATANAAANTIGNEVGFQSLRNFMDAIEDEKKGGSFAAYQTTSMLPFSSLLTQTASFMDPHMRVAKSMVNSLYYRIPEMRETLLPKRDPLYGQPMENPGYHGILRSLPIDTDPVKIELERVNLHPTAPRDVIGGVKLTPEQYDRYQATAGPLVQRALTSMVNHPGWQNLPLSDRADTLRATISAMRQQAATAIQIHDPKLIQQGLQQRLDYITGKTNTPRPKRPPELMIKDPVQLGIRG